MKIIDFPSPVRETPPAFPDLSEAELEDLLAAFEAASCEKTYEHDTDAPADNIARRVRVALVGRYRIFRRMHDDDEYWEDFNDHFNEFSTPRTGHEPWIIAAALALRPTSAWHWELVETWSWVFRHAAILGIPTGEFQDWINKQEPTASRAFVTEKLMRSGRVPAQLHADVATEKARSDV